DGQVFVRAELSTALFIQASDEGELPQDEVQARLRHTIGLRASGQRVRWEVLFSLEVRLPHIRPVLKRTERQNSRVVQFKFVQAKCHPGDPRFPLTSRQRARQGRQGGGRVGCDRDG